MVQLYSEIKPKSWLEMKDWFWALGAGTDWVFRGQRDEKWEINSSLERVVPASNEKTTQKQKNDIANFLIDSETKLFDKFSERVDQFAGSGEAAADTVLGKLALMQHHGVPTRLTDWTESPYVATFFATEDATDPEKNCAVWAISSWWCQVRSAESVRKALKLNKEKFPNWVDFALDVNLLDTVLRGNVPMVAPLRPLKLNTRIASQQGLFLCPGDLGMTFMENLRALGEAELPGMLYKLVFPANWRTEIFHDLFNMNIGPQTLFPGLDGFAKSLKLKMNWETESLDYLQYVRDSAAKDFSINYFAPPED